MIRPRQRILVLYLKTGGGHISIAGIIARRLEQQCGAEVFLADGFAPHQVMARAFFLGGYHITTAALRGAYSVFYDINLIKPILNITHALVSWRTSVHIARLIVRKKITKIVCTHFALGVSCQTTLRRLGAAAPLVMVVTDPFTAHPAWFTTVGAHFVVFSRELQRRARDEFGITARVFPFVLSEEFSVAASPTAAPGDVQRSADKSGAFHVLLAGGGEGLPGIVPLVRFLVNAYQKELGRAPGQKTPQFFFSVVCGSNKLSRRRLESFAKKTRAPLAVYGYSRQMPRLIAQSSCVITKAGASLVMETLAMRKPLIISTYIHGQELGNMRFVTQSGAGWFLQKPAAIYARLTRLALNPAEAEKAKQNAARTGIIPSNGALAEYIASL